MESPGPPFPAWVRKRDGRTEPFDSDKINRTLYAASESAGQPDPFVARELTDGVLHFLVMEQEAGTISSRQIQEVLIKVVRELGQPQVALAFERCGQERDRSLQRTAKTLQSSTAGIPLATVAGWLADPAGAEAAVRRCGQEVLTQFSLEEVYSRNLVSAHREGLISLGELAYPRELAAAVVRPIPASGPSAGNRVLAVFETFAQARHYVGRCVAVDALERELALRGGRLTDAVSVVRELDWATRALGLKTVLNLGSETGPSWTDEASPGPLFAEQWRPESQERTLSLLDAILDQFLALGGDSGVQVNWHLAGRDFTDEGGRQRLARLVRAALDGTPVGFVFDRPRRAVVLGEGLDRTNQATLVTVDLSLPALLRRLDPTPTAEAFRNKLMSLARLATGAGVQKRAYLRRHAPPDRPTFLLDRASMVIRLDGLEQTLAQLLDSRSWDQDDTAAYLLDLGQQLHDVLQVEGRHSNLNFVLDGELRGTESPRWDAGHVKATVRAAGRWHGLWGRGTAVVALCPDYIPPVDEVAELLHHAWKHTSVCRLRFTRAVTLERQLLTLNLPAESGGTAQTGP